jgi:hypothetical protein
MAFGLVLIFIGILCLYIVIDFLLVCGADMNKFGNKWTKKTLWLWLPIYALRRLIREVIFKKGR